MDADARAGEYEVHLLHLLRQLVAHAAGVQVDGGDDDVESCACEVWDACADNESGAFLLRHGIARVLGALVSAPTTSARLVEIACGAVANLLAVLPASACMHLFATSDQGSSTIDACLQLLLECDDADTLVQVCRIASTGASLCARSSIDGDATMHAHWVRAIDARLVRRMALIAATTLHTDLLSAAPSALHAILHHCAVARTAINSACLCFQAASPSSSLTSSSPSSSESTCGAAEVVNALVDVLAQAEPSVHGLEACTRLLDFIGTPNDDHHDGGVAVDALCAHLRLNRQVVPALARLVSDENNEQLRFALVSLISNLVSSCASTEERIATAATLLDTPDFLAGLVAMPPRAQLQDFALVFSALVECCGNADSRVDTFRRHAPHVTTFVRALTRDTRAALAQSDRDHETDDELDEDDVVALETVDALLARMLHMCK